MRKVTLITFALALAGCAGVKPRPGGCPPCPPCPPAPVSTVPVTAVPPAPPSMFVPAPADLPVFADLGDTARLMKAALLNRQYFQGLGNGGIPYPFGGRTVTAKELSDTNEEFIKILQSSPTAADLDRAIKEKFDIYEFAGRDSTGTVVFSSYYEPTLEASLKKTKVYKYPIYGRPRDLVNVNLEDFNPKFKGEKISGQVRDGALVPYLERDEIDFRGALKGKGLELAWFKNRADIMDLHIEGSGRLQLPDGKVIKANFAATNSLKFKGWLSAMVEAGDLPREGISHEKGVEYLAAHPDRERPVMSANKRYTFFKLDMDIDPETGPTGTYGLPLTGWRSIAIDNSLVPMGALAFLRADMPDVKDDGTLIGYKPDSRFVFCQDTGGAIKGPGRVDFFAGAGKKARTFAFKVWNQGQLYLLLLKENGAPRPAAPAN